MKFTLPVGGQVDFTRLIITSPQHKKITIGIKSGMRWCADPGVINGPKWLKGFNPDKFFPWLEMMEPYKCNCAFVPLPDVYANAIATLHQFKTWLLKFQGWPLAFIAQDGQELFDFPHPSTFHTVFVGGTTEWKESMEAVSVIKRAQEMGKHIHVGRVNWGKRYRLFEMLNGSTTFTCDGTRTRFDGVDRTLTAWRKYENPTQKRLIYL